MDAHFGPAWIGFAHTFAAEGEHDQAISAYSTAARLFQGAHLPNVFLGMQNLLLTNYSLAREYLKTAYDLCETDPLGLSEFGVVCFHEQQFQNAIQFFRRALKLGEQNNADPGAWLSIRTNLAHALRRCGKYEESLETFDHVLRHGGKDPAVFAAKGLVLLELERSWDAVVTFHEALAVAPQDPMATDLLNRALEANEDDSGLIDAGPGPGSEAVSIDEREDEEIEELDRRMNGRLREIEQNRVAGRRSRRRRHAQGLAPEDLSALGESMLVDSDEGLSATFLHTDWRERC